MAKRKNENGQLKKAFRDGELEGFRLVVTLIMWLLMQKHDMKPEEIKRLYDEIVYEFECLGGGYNTWDDIVKCVKDECDITVALKGR